MLRAAGFCPSAEDLVRPSGRSEPPALLRASAPPLPRSISGCAPEGRAAVERALGSGDPPLARLRRFLDAAASFPPAAPVRRPPSPGVLRGITPGDGQPFHRFLPVASSSAATLDRLKSDGSMPCRWFPTLFSGARRPRRSVFRAGTRGANRKRRSRAGPRTRSRRSLAILVKPQIWLWRGFTGDIAMESEADWEAWFRGYREYVVRFAVVRGGLPGRRPVRRRRRALARNGSPREAMRELIAGGAIGDGRSGSCIPATGEGVAAVGFWTPSMTIWRGLLRSSSASANPTDADHAAGARRAMELLFAAAVRTWKARLSHGGRIPFGRAARLSPHDDGARRARSRAEDSAQAAPAPPLPRSRGARRCRGLFWWKAFSDGREADTGAKTFNVVGRPDRAWRSRRASTGCRRRRLHLARRGTPDADPAVSGCEPALAK